MRGQASSPGEAGMTGQSGGVEVTGRSGAARPGRVSSSAEADITERSGDIRLGRVVSSGDADIAGQSGDVWLNRAVSSGDAEVTGRSGDARAGCVSSSGETGFIPTGYARWWLPRGRSILVHRRSAITALALLVSALLVGIITIATGSYELSPDRALGTFAGGGSETDRFIVLGQRLPRAVAALLVGAALGASGAIFQSLSRNPLGSPDLVGFTTGAASGGLVVILIAGTSASWAIMAGTITGGALTASAVLLIARRRAAAGERLILAGIAMAAMLASVNDYLISRATIEAAETARAWQFGSLNAIGWGPVIPIACALILVLPAAWALTRVLRIMELGDDVALGVGARAQRARVLAVALGTAFAGLAVATAGPIGFLALAAPQLARRLGATPGIALAPSVAMGCLLLVSADLAAQRVLSPFQIPVGLVTSALGGAYLLWLLLRSPGKTG